MTLRIAVEEGLTNVKQALRKEGFQITRISEGTMSNVDGAVISGLSMNSLGNHATQGNKFPVINADGLTAREVISSLQSRLVERT
jgi:hypothetical protein